MAVFWQVIIGLATIFIFGLGVGHLLESLQKKMPLLPPNEETKTKWEELTAGNEGGRILGNFERLLFFGAFWFNEPSVVAAWLAFKVASKWEVWANVISIPKTLQGTTDIEYLVARRRWGSQLLTTFLVGTLSNVLIGFLGVVFGREGFKFIVWMFC